MRIALVDPSGATRSFVARLLEARGHEVLPFSDEREGLRRIQSDPCVEALITGDELTFMSGFELCWETRLLATCRRPIYVLLMSSNGGHSNLIEALDSGADDFIGKPPLAEELYARLRAAERLSSMQRELIQLATTDPLTGLVNRRGFFEQATEACERSIAAGRVSAILLDIDNFKSINDSYGHDTGDEAIRACARSAAEAKANLVGRLGGDEFAMLLEQQSLSQAIAIAEDLRVRLAERPFETGRGPIRLTCSLGVSEGGPGDTVDELLKRADAALYDAKIGGRNRVVGASGTLLAVIGAERPRMVTRAAAR
jgi:two-component system, cell cycle response regulator